MEIVARGIFEGNPTRNQALEWTDAATPKKRYCTFARAALTALTDSGFVILPREPTEEMLQACIGASVAGHCDEWFAQNIYIAMRDAAMGGKG